MEQPKWLLLSAGIKERKTERKSRNLRFFSLGMEAYPVEKAAESVKYITLHADFSEENQALTELLSCHGETVQLVQWDTYRKAYNKGKICEALVEVLDDGSGEAMEPMGVIIRFSCGQEQKAVLHSDVNGIGFTAENQEVEDNA